MRRIEVIIEQGSTGDTKSKKLQSTSTPVKRHNIAKSIWNVITPRTKRKAALSLSIAENPVGLAMQIRQEIGINIIKHVEMVSSTKSKLGQATEAFFLQKHVKRVCPDKDKYVIDENTSKLVQLIYRLGHLHSLHQTFCV